MDSGPLLFFPCEFREHAGLPSSFCVVSSFSSFLLKFRSSFSLWELIYFNYINPSCFQTLWFFSYKAANLNRRTRNRRKPRAGTEVPILAQGRSVSAAQVPARTHNVPTPASYPAANTLKECKNASRREVTQDERPRGFPGKLPKNADFLWTGLPYGP